MRSLDLTCETEREFEYWYFGIKVGTLGACSLQDTLSRPAQCPCGQWLNSKNGIEPGQSVGVTEMPLLANFTPKGSWL